MGMVAFAWNVFMVMRKLPNCAECGRQHRASKKPSARLCPHAVKQRRARSPVRTADLILRTSSRSPINLGPIAVT